MPFHFKTLVSKVKLKCKTRPGVHKVKPKEWFKYSFYRLTIRNSARLFHHVLFSMGDMHLVLPALNLSTLNAGILIMMQQVRLMMFSLNMVDYCMSFLQDPEIGVVIGWPTHPPHNFF